MTQHTSEKLIKTALWAIEKMFEDGYDAYPSSLYHALAAHFGPATVATYAAERDAQKETAGKPHQ